MSGSGKDTWCVFVCFCVILALSFKVKSALDRAHAGFDSHARVNVLLSITRWKKSPPLTPPYLTFFVSTAAGKKKCVCSEESHCFSSVPTKKPRQLYRTQRNQTELTWQQTWTKKDAKCSPVTQTLVFLVQTSSCNFILESLWIPGTSILRYSI